MELSTEQECRAHVEAQLGLLVRSRTGWHASKSTEVPAHGLKWTLAPDTGGGWYTVEARLDACEFLVWFGNHQVGATGVHFIVRPAVHVAFKDLWPRSDPIPIRYSLCDVLEYMMECQEAPRGTAPRFDLNDFSLT